MIPYTMLSRYSTEGNPIQLQAPDLCGVYRFRICTCKGGHAYGFQPITLGAEEMEGLWEK